MRVWTLCVVLVLTGCAVAPPQAIDGDRSAGTVRVGVSQPMGLSPMFTDADWATADAVALERCRAWGYQSADGFGVICYKKAITGRCLDRLMVREYQCVQ